MFQQPKRLEVTENEMTALVAFIQEANAHTYASGADYSLSKSDTNFQEISYTNGKLTYKDRYSGYFAAAGESTVWFEDTPVWSASYRGQIEQATTGLRITEKDVLAFLKRALGRDHIPQSFRGPVEFREEEWEYSYVQKGELDRFAAWEEIYFRGNLVYSQDILGGVILHEQPEILTERISAFRDIEKLTFQKFLSAKEALASLPINATVLDFFEITSDFAIDPIYAELIDRKYQEHSHYITKGLNQLGWFRGWWCFRIALYNFLQDTGHNKDIQFKLGDIGRYSNTVQRLQNSPEYKEEMDLNQGRLEIANQEYADLIRIYTSQHLDDLFESIDQVLEELQSAADLPEAVTELESIRYILQQFFAGTRAAEQ